jgi:hypothetical protein
VLFIGYICPKSEATQAELFHGKVQVCAHYVQIFLQLVLVSICAKYFENFPEIRLYFLEILVSEILFTGKCTAEDFLMIV